jgi:spermidine synthase
LDPINEAKGDVLIAGLGLGVVASACLTKEGVNKVTVVEIAPEVVHLVGDHLCGLHGDRLEIIQADIFDWKPPRGSRWDVAWFDIWDNICGDNAEPMSLLKRRYGRRAGWKGCWCEHECRRHDREWKRQQREMERWR